MNGYLVMRDRARALRGNMTPAEQRVWDAVRKERCAGLRFRRQEVLGQYIADFYCPAERLVLEIDGPTHDTAEAQERDHYRSLVLQEFSGLRVVRLRNEMVLSSTIGEIRSAILDQLRQRS